MLSIRGIIWAGARTDRYEAMTAFCRDVLALPHTRDEGGAAFFDMPNGSRFEVLTASVAPDEYPPGVTAGFLVDDVRASRTELEKKGVEFLGPVWSNAAGDEWTQFRAPDGNVYSLTRFGEPK